jgi:spore maturation protein CgeB
MNDYEGLTTEEIIDDIFTRAFVMMLGVQRPSEEVLTRFSSWCKMQSSKSGMAVTEDFVLAQIPLFIDHLYTR